MALAEIEVMPPETQELLALRRSIGRLRMLAAASLVIALVAGAAALAALSSRNSRPTSQQPIQIRDSSGRVRIRMGLDQGEPVLGFFNPSGTNLVSIGITPQHQPHLGMFSLDGGLKVAIGTVEDGTPSVALFGPGDEFLAGMSLAATVRPVLFMKSSTSASQAMVRLQPDDQFALQLLDRSGAPAALLPPRREH